MKKIVFFDADQTILDMRKGIPNSAKRAVEQLVKNGHEAFLCTGRSYSFVPDEVRDMAFTGVIANGGAYMQHGGKVLLDEEVSTQVAWETTQILRKNHLIPVLEGTDFMYFDLNEYTNDIDGLSNIIHHQLGNRWRPIAGNEKNLHMAKTSAKISKESDFESAYRELSPWYDYVQHRNGEAKWTIEFTIKGHTKGTAVKKACEWLNIPIEDSVCFGDSNNDITMFEAAHTGVAMGNSVPEIKERAAFVTDTVFEDGILHGLQRLQLV